MRRFPLALALACAALASPALRAADNQLTPEEKAAGWQLLFNGRTFDGWEDPAAQTPPNDSFVIENGCIKSTPRPRIMEDLFSQGQYRNFELTFDWKTAPAGNSGVKYRIEDRIFIPGGPGKFEDKVNAALRNRPKARPSSGQEYVIGFEYQVLDNEKNPDARNGTTHQAGALYDVFSPLSDATRPVGEFNHSRLVVSGEHIEHWLNGVKVVVGRLDAPEVERNAAKRWGIGSPVYDLLVKQPRKATPISLQNHNSEAWFKNIKIRKLE